MKSTDIAVWMVVLWFIALNCIALFFIFESRKSPNPIQTEFRVEQKTTK